MHFEIWNIYQGETAEPLPTRDNRPTGLKLDLRYRPTGLNR